MSVIVWEDVVKITTVEVSRESFFSLTSETRRLVMDPEKREDPELERIINDLVVCAATYLVEVRDGEGWREVTGEDWFEYQGVRRPISIPITPAGLSRLPLTLSLRWTEVATRDNQFLTSTLFFGQGEGPGLTTKNEPQSAPAP